MFLILYPVVNETKLERHSFDNISSKEDAIEAVRKLNECEDAVFYNISTTSYSGFFMNLDEFVGHCNDEEINLSNYWMIHIDLTEKDVMEAILGCKD